MWVGGVFAQGYMCIYIFKYIHTNTPAHAFKYMFGLSEGSCKPLHGCLKELGMKFKAYQGMKFKPVHEVQGLLPVHQDSSVSMSQGCRIRCEGLPCHEVRRVFGTQGERKHKDTIVIRFRQSCQVARPCPCVRRTSYDSHSRLARMCDQFI